MPTAPNTNGIAGNADRGIRADAAAWPVASERYEPDDREHPRAAGRAIADGPATLATIGASVAVTTVRRARRDRPAAEHRREQVRPRKHPDNAARPIRAWVTEDVTVTSAAIASS